METVLALALLAAAPSAETLDSWAYEPVALSHPSFEFRLDRRDASFFVKDARTGVAWYSSWGRRGFASVRLAASAGEAGSGEKARGGEGAWLPLDRVEDIRADDRSIRFRAGSSAGAAPEIRFEIRALEPPAACLRIAYEIPARGGEAAPEIAAVRLLDRAFWVGEADGGWVALPRGLGERLVPGPQPAETREPEAEFDLRFVGFQRSGATGFLRWTDAATSARVERMEVSDPRFPGSLGLFTTVECRGRSGSVEFWTLGREWSPIVDVARGYASVSRPRSEPVATLRQKVVSPRDRAGFLGAAIFRPRVADSCQAEAVARAAERLRRELDVDRAAIVASGWADPEGDGLRFRASGGAEGEAALLRLGREIRELGWIFGLEVPAWRASFAEDGDPEVLLSAWGTGGVSLPAAEVFGGLARRFEPELVLVGRPPPGPRGAPEDPRARAALGRALREAFGLAAFAAPVEADLEHGSYLEGLLDPLAAGPPGPDFWPVLTAAFGHAARFGVSPGRALSAGDAEAALAHLLLGEVPAYELPRRGEPEPPEADPRYAFARREGWALGKDLSPQEIFLKNTYLVLSHVARLRAREQLLYHRALDGPGRVRETYFGPDLRIVVNFGAEDYEDLEDGFAIPRYGFVVRHPFLLAFHARKLGENSYERPAFYCVLSLEGKMYLRAERVLIHRGFGPETISLGGKTFRVERQEIVKIW